MPPRDQQMPLLTTLQSRVTARMLQAQSIRHGLQLTRPEAELLVWRELEAELLRLPH